MGVYKDGDLTGTTLALDKVIYGIRVDFDAGKTKGVYRVVKNGVEDATETDVVNNVSDAANNDTQEIAIDGDKVKINFYAGGSATPTLLTGGEVVYSQEKLRPFVAFFGSRSTTQVEMIRQTPSPYNEVMPTVDLSEGRDRDTTLTVPPKPKPVNNNDENFLFFQSPVLADFLGFNNQRSPLTGSLLSPEASYT